MKGCKDLICVLKGAKTHNPNEIVSFQEKFSEDKNKLTMCAHKH